MEELFEKSLEHPVLNFHGAGDIAEHAKELGSKFEQLITQYDLAEKLNPLMKHVIYLLEQIDLLVRVRSELLSSNEQQLQRLLQLEHERREQKQEKIRFQVEVDQIEDTFRQENDQLTQLVNKLKDENARLVSIINQEESNRQKYESSFTLVKEEVNNHYQNLLENEKKKCQNIQKELDFRVKKCEKLEEELERKVTTQLCMRDVIQQLKDENTKQAHTQHAQEQRLQHQLDLINAIKQQLSNTIQNHLEEQIPANDESQNSEQQLLQQQQTELHRQKIHLQQLQMLQKQVATLCLTAESALASEETIDSVTFQQQLENQLNQLQQEQQEQTLLLSANASPLTQSPLRRPAFKGQDTKFWDNIERKANHQFSVNEVRNLCLERNSLQQQVKHLKRQLKKVKAGEASSKESNDDSRLSSNTESDQSSKSQSPTNIRYLFAENCTQGCDFLMDNSHNHFNVDKTTKNKVNNLKVSGVYSGKNNRRDIDAPVEGPINQEPEDKIRPSKQKRLLSFFPHVDWSKLKLN